MDEITLSALEYTAVLSGLEGFALTPLGRELIRGLRPFNDILKVEQSYRETKEAVSLLNRNSPLPLGGISDIRGFLKRLKPGAYLLPEELLEIKRAVEGIGSLKNFSNPSLKNACPIITFRIDSLSTPRSIHTELERLIDDNGNIKDDSTQSLFNIRNSMAALKERLRKTVEELIRKKRFTASLMEELYTVRDDRYVLCVKAGHHEHFKGIVLGRSASGSTYFIEPMETVEINNRLAILKKEEKEEEVEILREVSSKLLTERDTILSDLETVAALDLSQAKAVFKKEVNGVMPALKKEGGIKFIGARHPILVFKEKRGGGRVIPVDLVMGGAKRVLVISGANAGGKTVALKTLGLLILMCQSGIPIPAEGASEAPFFSEVFAEIGDRQNITDDLSTFSGHIQRLSLILGKGGRDTLVLIDEIGVGTDPSEGSVLALSILEKLKEKGASTVVTTHLNLLKAYAATDADFENASVEFDEKTLMPRYTVRYGVPGESYGLKIAEKFGIPGDIIVRAKARLTGGEGFYTESILRVEEERERVRALREKLEGMEEKRDKALSRLRDDRKILLDNARKKIESIIEKAESDIKETIGKAKEGRGTHPKGGSGSGKAAVEAVKERVLDVLFHGGVTSKPSAGDSVEIPGSLRRGVVLRVDEGRKTCEVAAGSLRVWARWENLKKVAPEPKDGSKGRGFHSINGGRTPSTLNLIGMRAEEAIKEAARFIDDAHLNGIERVELVHGVGTGRLRKALHAYLGGNPLVGGFADRDPLENRPGVTVVEIK
ncbi:MAG: endonuclease MutS2 [Deltaproteobacteria bacterium]|nr:endonuclease MutS2 [Deltaproteobacteria bacterium]